MITKHIHITTCDWISSTGDTPMRPTMIYAAGVFGAAASLLLGFGLWWWYFTGSGKRRKGGYGIGGRDNASGHFLAWISLVPVFLSFGGFVSHFIFRRELQGIFFAIGLLISQVVNEFIKTSVQQARPETCALLEMCDSHGWPSSHSQYMFFFAVYFTLLTHYRIGSLFRNQMAMVLLVIWPLALLTMYSRVYLGYHTVAQVFAGAALGIALGGGWFWVVNNWFRCHFPAMEESAIGRLLYVKDTSHIPNVLKFEYENTRAARKAACKRSD